MHLLITSEALLTALWSFLLHLSVILVFSGLKRTLEMFFFTVLYFLSCSQRWQLAVMKKRRDWSKWIFSCYQFILATCIVRWGGLFISHQLACSIPTAHLQMSHSVIMSLISTVDALNSYSLCIHKCLWALWYSYYPLIGNDTLYSCCARLLLAKQLPGFHFWLIFFCWMDPRVSHAPLLYLLLFRCQRLEHCIH